ncbi:uncharacterized protein DEA37_0007537, partial [Paragonimus westermani]
MTHASSSAASPSDDEIIEDCLRHPKDADVDLLPDESLTDLDQTDNKVLLFNKFQTAQIMLDAIPHSAKYFKRTYMHEHESVKKILSILTMEVNSSRELDSETAVIEVNEMPVGMQADAVRFTVDAMNRGHDEGIMATYVKRAFDKTYEPSWHCVVGRNFG